MKALLIALVALALVGGGLYYSGVFDKAKEGIDKTTEVIEGDANAGDDDQQDDDAEEDDGNDENDNDGQQGRN